MPLSYEQKIDMSFRACHGICFAVNLMRFLSAKTNRNDITIVNLMTWK